MGLYQAAGGHDELCLSLLVTAGNSSAIVTVHLLEGGMAR